MLNFPFIQESLLKGDLHGAEIAEYRRYVAVWLSRMREEYGGLISSGAKWRHDHRQEFKHKADCDAAWEASEEGQRAEVLKHEIRSREDVAAVLTSEWFAINREEKEAGAL